MRSMLPAAGADTRAAALAAAGQAEADAGGGAAAVRPVVQLLGRPGDAAAAGA